MKQIKQTMARLTRRAAMGVAVMALASQAMAQDRFPGGPVTLVLAFPAGSTSDTIARVAQTHLTAKWGVPVIVENKPGASGEIAYTAVANSNPDGRTLLLTPDAIVVNPILKNQDLSTVTKRFKPVTVLAEAPLAFIIPASLPVKDLKDFVQYVKARPKQLNFGSSGVGSVPYLSAAYFMQRTGTELVHIPYRGAAQTMSAMFAGDVVFFLGDVNRYLTNKDRLRAIVVTGARRDPRAPDVPTLAEAGYPGAAFGLWLGVFAPASTPADVVARINKDLTEVMTSAEFQSQMRANGYESNARSVEQTDRFVRDGYAFWRKVVVDGKLKFED